MDFRTIVPLPAKAPVISPDVHALVVGSCFAEHIGERLRTTLGPEQCCVNPFGVLYNPQSIALALQMLLAAPTGIEDYTPERLDDYIFEGRDGLFHSWMHSTKYSARTREECRERCWASMAEARRVLEKADLLVVTFGTSRHYALADGTIVANCHKELASQFTEHDSTVDEIVATWRPLLAKLQRLRPTLQVVFTVSPYRYRKYGYHASQLAKARLLLAVEELQTHPQPLPEREGRGHHFFCNAFRGESICPLPCREGGGWVFPAYEIVLDELRDYRFYKPDMLHPSEQAVDYIWERFREWAFTPEMNALYQQRIKEQKAQNHYANH